MARFGKIGDQYFDDAGDPLIGGKLYFYESGTTTQKTTYADVNQSQPNPNPVILTAAGRQPNIFFEGSARVVLTDADDNQIEVRDPEGGSAQEGVFSPWNSLTIYNINDIVEGSNGRFYISITDGNQDNDPTSDTLNWSEIKFVGIWNTNESYSINDIVQGSNGLIYSSKIDNNQGNNPVDDIGFVNWGAGTAATVPPVVRSASKVYAYRNF